MTRWRTQSHGGICGGLCHGTARCSMRSHLVNSFDMMPQSNSKWWQAIRPPWRSIEFPDSYYIRDLLDKNSRLLLRAHKIGDYASNCKDTQGKWLASPYGALRRIQAKHARVAELEEQLRQMERIKRTYCEWLHNYSVYQITKQYRHLIHTKILRQIDLYI